VGNLEGHDVGVLSCESVGTAQLRAALFRLAGWVVGVGRGLVQGPHHRLSLASNLCVVS